MQTMFIRSFVLFFCVLTGSMAWAATPDVLTQACVQCHGTNGVSSAAKTPHLNGQLVDYLEETISALARGERQGSVSNHVPKTWSRQDVAAVAKYYANSKGVRPVQAVSTEKAVAGRQIYLKRCAECHPDNGRQSEHDAPFMAAQNLEYLIEQAQEFVTGKRKFVFMMDDAFRGLSAAELETVAHFFASQDQHKK
jgi:sulfide dehydrogenase cytochrome subunit